MGEETAVQAATRTSWMRHVCKTTWWQRYKPEKKRPTAWGDPAKKREEAEETSEDEEEERGQDKEDDDNGSDIDSDSSSAGSGTSND